MAQFFKKILSIEPVQSLNLEPLFVTFISAKFKNKSSPGSTFCGFPPSVSIFGFQKKLEIMEQGGEGRR